MSQLAQLFEISNTSERNYSPTVDDPVIDQLAIDDIKVDFNPTKYHLPFPYQSDDPNEQIYREQMLHFYIRDLNARELTPFYQENIKTGYIQTLLETVIDGIFDGVSFIESGTRQLTSEQLEDIAFNMLVHGRVLITRKTINEEDEYTVVPPYRYWRDISTDRVVVYHYTLDNQPLREEYLEHQIIARRSNGETFYKLGKPLEGEFFEMEMRPLVTDGMLELAMLRSLVYTLLQSDLWGGSTINFIDEQYLDEKGRLNAQRVNYTPTQSVENLNADGAGNKPLFETVTPEVRSNEFDSILTVIDNATSALAGMTSEVLGSSNATEAQAMSAKTAKRFNKLKAIFQKQINNTFKHFNISKRIDLSRYRSDSDEVIIRNAVLVSGSNLGTVRPFLVKLYPELTEDELDTLYIKGEIKAGRPLTEDEKELAIKLGLQTEELPEEAQPTEGGVTEVSDPMTTDSEIAASELTPGQGVSDPEKTT